jgi:hypothetical protein
MKAMKIYLWDQATCEPRLDDNGNQMWVASADVDLIFNEDGSPRLDECGKQVWHPKVVPTTTTTPPPVGGGGGHDVPPPVFGNPGVQWKWILVGVAAILLFAWLFA